VTWWCSAQGLPWTWTWRAYPGVWLVVLALAGAYLWAIYRMLPPAGRTDAPAASRPERTLFAVGVVSVWIALDWPVGALGAGYLLSVHQLQYVLLVMVAPPLLLMGMPVWLLSWLTDLRGAKPLAQFVTRPLPAIVICNAIVVVTHLPAVVDGFMATQFGSFLLDMSWLTAGLILWWPVLRRIPELNGLTYPARFGYLLAVTLVPGVPAAFMFFSDYPIYALYELAPPVGLLPARDDQFVGGIIMKLGSFMVILVALTVLWFRWHASERVQKERIALPRPVA
jgi:putative membrane protein